MLKKTPLYKVIVVGIGGATRSGKSTLAHALAREWDAPHAPLSMDAYFLPRARKPFNQELVCVDNESPESLDKEYFLANFEESCKTHQREADRKQRAVYLFVEGFLLYSFPTIVSRLDIKIFLSITQQICFSRRMRTKRGTKLEYFNRILWPSYVKYNSKVLLIDNVLILDGSQTTSKLAQLCNDFIEGKTPENWGKKILEGALAATQIMRQKDLEILQNEIERGKDKSRGSDEERDKAEEKDTETEKQSEKKLKQEETKKEELEETKKEKLVSTKQEKLEEAKKELNASGGKEKEEKQRKEKQRKESAVYIPPYRRKKEEDRKGVSEKAEKVEKKR